jgi:hypothetical protein
MVRGPKVASYPEIQANLLNVKQAMGPFAYSYVALIAKNPIFSTILFSCTERWIMLRALEGNHDENLNAKYRPLGATIYNHRTLL